MNGHINTSTMRTPTMPDYLQNAFQAQQFKTLSAAQDKLQTHMTNFAATINENSSIIDQQRLTKMKYNIALLNDYLTEKTNTAINTNHHLNALSTRTSTSNNLLDINPHYLNT